MRKERVGGVHIWLGVKLEREKTYYCMVFEAGGEGH
jgi:hypothetical protein